MELRAIKSFYDHREGLVTLEDDVLSVVSQIREMYGQRIRVAWEPTTEYFVLTENCEDGTERLIFTTDTLDGRTLTRLIQGDSQLRGAVDPYDWAEREQDRIQAEMDQQKRQELRQHGERLAHALKKEGIQDHLPLQVSLPRGVDDA